MTCEYKCIVVMYVKRDLVPTRDRLFLSFSVIHYLKPSFSYAATEALAIFNAPSLFILPDQTMSNQHPINMSWASSLRRLTSSESRSVDEDASLNTRHIAKLLISNTLPAVVTYR